MSCGQLHTEIFPAVSWGMRPRVGAQVGSASWTRGKELAGEAECTAPVPMRCEKLRWMHQSAAGLCRQVLACTSACSHTQGKTFRKVLLIL